MSPVLAQALLAMAAFAESVTGGGPDPNFQVVDVLTGNDAEVPTPQIHVATDPLGWAKLWAYSFGYPDPERQMPNVSGAAKPLPRVDFNRNFVVGVFGGTLGDQNGYRVVEFTGRGRLATIVLEPVPRSFLQPNLVASPYALIVARRTWKRVGIYVRRRQGNSIVPVQVFEIPPTLETKAEGGRTGGL